MLNTTDNTLITAKQDHIYLAAGLILTGSEVWKQLVLTFLLNGGAYQWSFIPFQLCSIPMYLCLLIYLFRDTKLRRIIIIFLSDFSLMSGIIAFLDTSGMHYGYTPLTVHSYLWHLAIAGIGFYSGIISLNMHRKCSDFAPAAVLFFICCGIAELINLSLDRFGVVDMFYINPHYYMNQIVFSSMTEFLPNNAVILIYILTAVLGAFIVHVCWMTACKLYRRK